jgi:hypothetical protein
VNPLDISLSYDLAKLQIGIPWNLAQKAVLTIPQFYAGVGGDNGCLIDQTLTWKPSETPDAEAVFSLDVPSEETGIQFGGKLLLPKPGEALVRLNLKNVSAHVLEEGHHTALLNFPEGEGYDDPDGKNTFFHGEFGWVSLADLCARVELKSLHLPIRMGSNFKGLTVIWNLIARVYPKHNRVAGYACASDHPDWGTSLLAGFRWGAMMNPGESRNAWMRLYFLEGGLEQLHERFFKDRRER